MGLVDREPLAVLWRLAQACRKRRQPLGVRLDAVSGAVVAHARLDLLGAEWRTPTLRHRRILRWRAVSVGIFWGTYRISLSGSWLRRFSPVFGAFWAVLGENGDPPAALLPKWPLPPPSRTFASGSRSRSATPSRTTPARPRARDRAIAATKAPWLCITDHDMDPAPGYQAAPRGARARQRAHGGDRQRGARGGLAGAAPVRGDEEHSMLALHQGLQDGKRRAQGAVLVTQNVSLARSAYERVGGFDLGLRLGEDTELGWRPERDGPLRVRAGGTRHPSHARRLVRHLAAAAVPVRSQLRLHPPQARR